MVDLNQERKKITPFAFQNYGGLNSRESAENTRVIARALASSVGAAWVYRMFEVQLPEQKISVREG